jgi:hypothetical protein
MIRKTNLRLLLALVLCAALLAGCGKSGDTTTKNVETAPPEPRDIVAEALTATRAAFDLEGKSAAEGPVHQELTLHLADANVGMDLSELYGSGLRLTSESDSASRKAAGILTLDVAGAEMLSVKLQLEDNMLYLSSGELLGDRVLAVNTETLGTDFPGLEAEGFNVFENMTAHGTSLSQETANALDAEWERLFDGALWAEDGKITVTAGADSAECARYTMTVEARALVDCVCSSFNILTADSAVEAMLRSAMAGELDDYESYEDMVEDKAMELREELESAVTEPVAVEYALSGGLVRQISTALHGEEEAIDFRLTLGLGENVKDYIGLVCGTEEDRLELTSQGRHTAADAFTDHTVLTITDDGAEELALDSTLERAADGAFALRTEIVSESDTINIDAAGTYLKDDGISLKLDSLKLNFIGFEVTLEGSYVQSSGSPVEIDHTGAMELAQLTEAEQADLGETLENNLTALMFRLISAAPSLIGVLA